MIIYMNIMIVQIVMAMLIEIIIQNMFLVNGKLMKAVILDIVAVLKAEKRAIIHMRMDNVPLVGML